MAQEASNPTAHGHAVDNNAVPVADSATVAKNVANRGPLNEVVCGAMMLAYERSGCWQQVSSQDPKDLPRIKIDRLRQSKARIKNGDTWVRHPFH
jgi:hypothetical protein